MDFLTQLHGMAVHFPIALLSVAVLLQVLALHPRLTKVLESSVLITLVLGTLGAGLSVLSGPEDNARGVSQIMHAHERWAQLTLLLFAVITVVKLWGAVRSAPWSRTRAMALLLASLVGFGMLTYTGLLGGQMVYEEAVGVNRNGALVAPPSRGFRGNR